MLDDITPIVITYNEQENIGRTLEHLTWAKKVLIIDSFSTDKTLKIIKQFSNTHIIQHAFADFANQCNFALDQVIETDWVLSLDADYVLSKALIDELAALEPKSSTSAYETAFTYKINGKALRGTLYPPRTTLYRKNTAKYEQDGHAHRVLITGKVSQLKSKIYHDDRKPYSRWLASQKKYAAQEAIKLKSTPWAQLSWPDRIRKVPMLSLFAVVPYTLLVKGLVFDGLAGLSYCWQRFRAELAIQAALFTNSHLP